MIIWAHTLVRNEERYVWYAIKSVVDHVDKVMVWDTGSDDNTVELIKLLKKEYPGKIEFEEFGVVTPQKYTVLRQKMLERTEADWFMILDGDEVWWRDSIKNSIEVIRKDSNKLDTIVNPYKNVIGDIFHYQEERAGRYEIGKYTGHINIRFINRNIPGLYTSKPHGQHGYFNGQGVPIQELDENRRLYLDYPYMHFTNVQRSGRLALDSKVPKRKQKYKYEEGIRFPLDYYYPEVFFIERPKEVRSPWLSTTLRYRLYSNVLAPIRSLKRRLSIFGPSGY